MINFEKKQVKIISLVIAAVFILSIVAIGVAQYDSAIASATSSSNVGVVDYRTLVSSSPQLAKIQQELQQEQQKEAQEFKEKAASMNDQQKAALMAQLQENLMKKQRELLNPVMENIKKDIKTVADAKGLTVVLDKSNVVYGGQDITQDVMARMRKQAK